MADKESDEIWVTTKEGAEITGYSQRYLTILAGKISHLPESERLIQIRNRSNRYEFWLPDLFTYIAEHGTGPKEHIQRSKDK